MRYAFPSSLLAGTVALIAFPTSSFAQVLPTPVTPSAGVPATPRAASATDPRVQAAAVVAPQPRPAAMAPAATARPATTTAPPVQASTYWGPAKPAAPKRKPSALRRFFNRFGGDDENYDPEQGMKVTRDMATGRTNIFGSKPWMSPSP